MEYFQLLAQNSGRLKALIFLMTHEVPEHYWVHYLSSFSDVSAKEVQKAFSSLWRHSKAEVIVGKKDK